MVQVIARCVTVFFCSLLLLIGSCNMHRNSLVVDAIKAGADPVRARLAMDGEFPATTVTILTEFNQR